MQNLFGDNNISFLLPNKSSESSIDSFNQQKLSILGSQNPDPTITWYDEKSLLHYLKKHATVCLSKEWPIRDFKSYVGNW